MSRRFNARALLLVTVIVVILQYLRPRLLRSWPGLELVLGVAPNFLAGLGLPFTWAERGTWSAHRKHCLVVALALTGYELAQLSGYVLSRRWFDPNDILASWAGAALAAAVGWLRRPAAPE